MSMETRGTKTYCGCKVAEASLSGMAGTTMCLKMTRGGGEILGQPYREREGEIVVESGQPEIYACIVCLQCCLLLGVNSP